MHIVPETVEIRMSPVEFWPKEQARLPKSTCGSFLLLLLCSDNDFPFVWIQSLRSRMGDFCLFHKHLDLYSVARALNAKVPCSGESVQGYCR